MTNLKVLSQIKNSVSKLFNLQQEKKEFDEYYETVRKKEQLNISNFMFCNLPKDCNSFDITLDEGKEFYSDPANVHVTKVQRTKITWYPEKLKKVLTKAQTRMVFSKTYIVSDMDGLVKYLKQLGADPKVFKRFISTQETIREPILNNMYQVGEIDRNKLEGCYSVESGAPYIKITANK